MRLVKCATAALFLVVAMSCCGLIFFPPITITYTLSLLGLALVYTTIGLYVMDESGD